ncbi:helix-turn-helix transcriptional regulator [Plantactinospora sp. B6F1]|uniref:response regulator transcription factor n=1 Tax=Plantactinospora sp. B6F1 TaxID=3158971 RepID=UPI0032D983C9
MSSDPSPPRHPTGDMFTVSRPVLTALQHEIVRMLARGASDSHIAHRLGLGLRTVQRNVSTIMQLLRVQSRFAAGVAVTRAGLLDEVDVGARRSADPTPDRPGSSGTTT